MATIATPSRPDTWRLTIGANVEHDGVRFRVWAPTASRVEVVVRDGGVTRAHAMRRDGDGYHETLVPGAAPGTRYMYRVDGAEYPDPASRAQPDGVHEASEVVDPAAFRWSDAAWAGLAPDALVIYELHVGAFTPEGTFDAAIEKLPHVAALGATAVEVMPVASFAGARNWGYDGVSLYAPSAAYGGPEAFRRFVDAAHALGIGVILDAVYNHLGPEGNYLPAITGGRFFTHAHHTPWGDAVNYDGPDSAPVRDFVIQNALHWAHEYHVDGLRLDATHAIVDDSPVHVLREIGERLHELTPRRVVIAEDERNERRVLLPPERGGLGLDAVWADDLHHQLRRLAAGDAEGYFASYAGTIDDVVETLRRGWFFEGQVAAHHGAPRGTSARGLPPSAFVVCLQNHDQVGNRALGDRLSDVVPPAVYRALSALLLVSPYTPLLWMGQEWAATSPFRYFTDHPEELGRLVTAGRRDEFRHFAAFADPAARDRIPDPQAESTFRDSKLRWDEAERPPHAGILALYRELLALRRRIGGAYDVERLGDGALTLQRGDVLAVINLADAPLAVPLGDAWRVLLDTEDPRFGGDTPATLDGGTLSIAGAGAVVLGPVGSATS